MKLSQIIFPLVVLFWILIIALISAGCETFEPKLDPRVYYKHDMLIKVNDKTAIGVVVSPRAESYNITITSQDDMDLLQITSCARDMDVSGAIKTGWFSKKQYSFVYTPNMVEKQPGCILKLAGYNKSQGKHSWAFIEFQDPDFVLPAGVSCNADGEYRSDGVTICQTLQHLITRIWFSSTVVLSSKVLDRCRIDASPDNKVFQFKTPNRECVFEFMEPRPPFRKHRLITVGYEEVPVREVQ